MIKVDYFLDNPSSWLKDGGPNSDVVVSSRIRLARNLAGYSFQPKLTEIERSEVVGKVETILKSIPFFDSGFYFRYRNLTEVDRQFLLERHLISREHAMEPGEKAVAIAKDASVSIMVLEEDHLRLQAFQSGFNLAGAWKLALQIEQDLEKRINYSFHPQFGYLTACPTNVGTGLRASCMLHLPSLVFTKQVHKVLQALSKLNLAARGLYGEGTQATGNFFQFSNQMTLGQKEEEIIDGLERVIHQVIGHEREARKHLEEKKKAKFADQVWRALGILKSARMIASQEATQLLSLVHLGLQMGWIQTGITHQELNALHLLIQPAHLQKIMKRTLTATERDARRADLIREKLLKVSL